MLLSFQVRLACLAATLLGIVEPSGPQSPAISADDLSIAGAASQDVIATLVPFCLGNGLSVQRVSCPCGSTGAAGHGCPNSQFASGAQLETISSTPLGEPILTASSMPPSSACLFLQGSLALSPVAPFGDGVRCVGGLLLRIGVKDASSGGAEYPEPGDTPIYAQSAALGDLIPSGGVRHYQTAYRDPDPASCPAPYGGTWNITNAISFVW